MFRLALAAALLALLHGCALVPLPPVSGSGDYLKVETLAPLAPEVSESSGLAAHKGQLWTLNDSANGPYLYAINEGQVARRVRLQGAANIDWESMAQDERYLYVADCGNNSGRRQWFQLYRIPWAELEAADTEVQGRYIEFRFADPAPLGGHQRHDNDCEASAWVDDQIWLLTKGWQSGRSRLYRLDPTAPEQALQAVAEWPVAGLITGLDYSARRQELVLLGYTLGRFNAESFIWRVPVQKGEPCWGCASRHLLWPAAQWEAVLWQGDDLLLTRESSLLGAARVGRIRLD